jgi:hypothetical protein
VTVSSPRSRSTAELNTNTEHSTEPLLPSTERAAFYQLAFWMSPASYIVTRPSSKLRRIRALDRSKSGCPSVEILTHLPESHSPADIRGHKMSKQLGSCSCYITFGQTTPPMGIDLDTPAQDLVVWSMSASTDIMRSWRNVAGYCIRSWRFSICLAHRCSRMRDIQKMSEI